jgi:processive 1,2-diacylglycerol beta-glucosyltransferase
MKGAHRMPRLYIEESNRVLGEVSDAELKVLFENLEEESAEDTDYYITQDTVDYLESRGADTKLVAMLRQAIGANDGVDIRWSR